jgi:hypothetical protein
MFNIIQLQKSIINAIGVLDINPNNMEKRRRESIKKVLSMEVLTGK